MDPRKRHRASGNISGQEGAFQDKTPTDEAMEKWRRDVAAGAAAATMAQRRNPSPEFLDPGAIADSESVSETEES